MDLAPALPGILESNRVALRLKWLETKATPATDTDISFCLIRAGGPCDWTF